jgi:hypothetical protein
MVGFVGLVFAVVAFAGFDSREASAAPKNPFTWSKYKAKDGKEYDNPRWDDAGGGKRWLSSAQGTLFFLETPPITKVVFKVYRHGAQGGWNPTEVIKYTLNPNPTYVGFPISGWTLVGMDNYAPKLEFAEGEELKIVWEVTTTQNNVNTLELVELIITVQYHAF